LIDDRNKILAKNLNNLKKNQNNKKILAIIGAGHKKEIKKLIKNEN
jgi:pheromone shutdown protein TraB